ncbi:MAG: hypothetical protein BGO21_05225 [Dyadobacter sp. 50-39]|uniref:hypothetical protein n=1 Tax=Dyadobacter sp. 50-39 TaxID=1895756 RepID=UPI00095F1C4F|nr:hypothetical protein [Dyadobacter sp. 50-39]OJV22560.1 MAG: hypothetical protein BGO21_05225 [Dyadobacter sp. 50-39]
MKIEKHLSDTEIQQYALGEFPTDQLLKAHIEQCARCSTQVRLYQQITCGLASAEPEAFEVDLVPLVLGRLPVPKSTRATGLTFVVCISVMGIIAVAGLFWFLNAGLAGKVFSDASAIMCGALLVGALLFSLLLTSIRWEYRQKFRQLTGPQSLQQYPGAAV